MTVLVPTALPVTSSWQLYDWLDKSYSGTADDTGVAEIDLPELPDNVRWVLTHVVIGASTAATGSKLRLYVDTVSNAALRDGSSKGDFDVADWAMGLMVPPSTHLIARWTGLEAGDTTYINLQAQILQRTS